MLRYILRKVCRAQPCGRILRGFCYSLKRGVIMPRKPKRPCAYPGCPELTDGLYCEEHKKQENKNYNRYRRNPETEKIYRSRTWRIVRRQYFESHPLCEDCLLEGKIIPAEEVHHIKPLSAGGKPYSFDNLRSLCRSCHLKEHHRIGDR